MVSFDEIDLRLLSLGLKHGKSCERLLDQDNYRSWWNKERIEEHNGIIWIQDKRLVEKSGWKSVILERIFQRVVQGLGDRELQTYVDALDECGDSELREIVTFFQNIMGGVATSKNPFSLRICLASRPCPTIGVIRGTEIVLDRQTQLVKTLSDTLNPN
ncbi:hypothetical protein RJZ56_001330 [Blastomyces dermatitidis]